VAAADGRFSEAAHLLGAAAATREPTGTPPGLAELADLDRTETAARAALGPAFNIAYAAGTASDPDSIATDRRAGQTGRD
jgi:hypothetical protein